MSRLEAIRKIVADSPNDPFPRYGLALELKNTGQKEEAEATFAELEARFPAYVPQYLMRGALLRELGRSDEARGVFQRGIDAARAAGNAHALGELQQALADLDEEE
jgi:tetratricopeptide (TPR) repeat protein